jgi:hypothetical protein
VSSVAGKKSEYQNTGVMGRKRERCYIRSKLDQIDNRVPEIPRTPPLTEETAYSPHPLVTRVVGKWSSAEGYQYLVLSWLQLQEGFESAPK